MKLYRPDPTATSKWKSGTHEFEAEIKVAPTLRETNNIMANTHELDVFEQNRFVVSAMMTKIVTKIEDEKGKQIKEIPREEIKTNGVYLIDSEFLEMLPATLFLELADICMARTFDKMTDQQAKN